MKRSTVIFCVGVLALFAAIAVWKFQRSDLAPVPQRVSPDALLAELQDQNPNCAELREALVFVPKLRSSGVEYVDTRVQLQTHLCPDLLTTDPRFLARCEETPGVWSQAQIVGSPGQLAQIHRTRRGGQFVLVNGQVIENPDSETAEMEENVRMFLEQKDNRNRVLAPDTFLVLSRGFAENSRLRWTFCRSRQILGQILTEEDDKVRPPESDHTH